MNYNEAAAMFEAQWQKRKDTLSECVFPYDKRYKDDEFVHVIVPCITCKLQATDTDRVNKYIDAMLLNDDFGPGWVAYGKRLSDGTVVPFEHKRLFVHDGNHRIAARQVMGKFYTEVVMPASNYDLYMREYNGE